MEIKDVNKLTNMFFNQSSSASSVEGVSPNPAALQSNSSIKDEFMALLQQTSGGISFSSLAEDEKNSIASVSSNPINRTSKQIVSKQSDTDWNIDKNVSADQVDTASSDKSAAAKDTASSASDKDSVAKDSASSSSQSESSSQDKSGDDNKAPDNTSSSASENASASSTADKNSAQQAPSDTADAANEVALTDEGTVNDSISNQVIDELLGMLASLGINVADLNSLSGEIKVVNAATSETMVMNVTELLSALKNQTEIMIPLVNMDGQINADVVLMPLAEISASLQDSGVDISSMEPVLNKFSAILQNSKDADNLPEITTSQSDADASLQTIQGEALSNKVKTDKKVSISVKVQEENFSYKTAEESVSTPLNSITANKSDSAETQPQSLQNSTANSAAQLQGGLTANAQAMTGTAAPLAADKITEAQLSGIKDIANGSNTNTLQHAGSEAAQLAKTEQTSTAEAKNTSFRDVYKGMSKEAIEQIKVNITKSAVKGVDKIEIQLKPEDLGHIEIKMHITKDGKLQAHIISSRAETMDMLQKDMSSLEKAFNDAGFNTDEGSFSFSFREMNNEQNYQEALRNFLGEILEQDTANSDILPDMASGDHWDGKSALTIRV